MRTLTEPTIDIGTHAVSRAMVADPDATRAADPGTPIKFTATTEGVKRDGLDLHLDGLDTTNYERNPVFLWVHDYRFPPIGRVVKINRLKKRIDMWVQFDQADPFAVEVERKYREGYLNAVSIGWIILEFERADDDDPSGARYHITASDLLDLSAVPVPGDPDALMPRELAALRSLSTSQQPTITPRVTDDGEDDDDDTDWRRVATEMVDLYVNGVTLDVEDAQNRYRRLSRSYRKAGLTPPEPIPMSMLGALTPPILRTLFVNGEWDIYEEETRMDAEARLRAAAIEMRDAADALLATMDAPEEETPKVEDGADTLRAFTAIRDAIIIDHDDEGETHDE